MSLQKGNVIRTRPQKYKNHTAFKNNLHDTSPTTKLINSITVSDVCQRCKEIIEWKIKYKKYKPLTQPKKCVKCDQRKVYHAYHVTCTECGEKLKICTKCCKAKEIVPSASNKKNEIKLDDEMQATLKSLPERKRRTFLRYLNKVNNDIKNNTDTISQNKRKEDVVLKLKALKLSVKTDDDYEDDGDDDDDYDYNDDDADADDDDDGDGDGDRHSNELEPSNSKNEPKRS